MKSKKHIVNILVLATRICLFLAFVSGMIVSFVIVDEYFIIYPIGFFVLSTIFYIARRMIEANIK